MYPQPSLSLNLYHLISLFPVAHRCMVYPFPGDHRCIFYPFPVDHRPTVYPPLTIGLLFTLIQGIIDLLFSLFQWAISLFFTPLQWTRGLLFNIHLDYLYTHYMYYIHWFASSLYFQHCLQLFPIFLFIFYSIQYFYQTSFPMLPNYSSRFCLSQVLEILRKSSVNF